MALPTSLAPALTEVKPVVQIMPPRENGDFLSRDEFERRYGGMRNLKKAELIEREVYLPSPGRWKHHAGPSTKLHFWLGYYQAFAPGVEAGGNASLRLDTDNEPQPDGALLILPSHGGQAKFSEDDYVVGSPELLGEIAASTVSIDLHTKFRVYRRNGVREYIVWRVEDEAIDWFVLRQGQFDRLAPDAVGVYRSEVFPGLWLDAAAMVRGDMAAVLKVLQDGINSPEHASFMRELQERASKS
jgi:hypothetical protein